MAKLLPAVLLAHALGCTGGDPVATPAAAVERPASEPAAAESEVVAEPFASALAKLDPSTTRSVPVAVDLFVARHSDPAADEQARYHDLNVLLLFLERVELAASHRIQQDEAFAGAVMHHIGEGEGYPAPSASARAEIDALARDGLRVVRIDGLLVSIDPRWLAARTTNALSPAARRYLDALAWDVEHTARMDGDQPDDLVASIRNWEKLVEAGEPYAAVAYRHMRQSAELYLGLSCYDPHDEPTRCRVTPPMRASYERFVAEHTTSRYHAAVACFLKRAEARTIPIDDAIALQNECLHDDAPQ